LYAVSRDGHLAIVELLCSSGVCLKRLRQDTGNPLFAAASEGHAAVVERLIKAGA